MKVINFMEKIFKILSLIFISTGVVVVGCFLYKLKQSPYYPIATPVDISTEITAEIGTFINGILGTVSALVGVLLFYLSLELQRKELSEQRKEFQTSRYTTIIYNQLNQINLITNEFYYGSQKGLYAFYAVSRDLKGDNANIVVHGLSENLVNFMQAFKTFCMPVIDILESPEQNDKKELANLFFSNIDAKIIESINEISKIKVKKHSVDLIELEKSQDRTSETEINDTLFAIKKTAQKTHKLLKKIKKIKGKNG